MYGTARYETYGMPLGMRLSPINTVSKLYIERNGDIYREREIERERERKERQTSTSIVIFSPLKTHVVREIELNAAIVTQTSKV